MTTIVYRDGILAGDTRAYSGDSVPIGQKQKIYRVETSAGSVSFGISTPHPGLSEEIRSWFLNEKDRDHEPVLNGKSFYALEITDDGEVYYYHDCFTPSGPLIADYFAIGSGCEYALGALAHGASAIEAVVAASKNDAWTGGQVQHIRVPLVPIAEEVEHDAAQAA